MTTGLDDQAFDQLLSCMVALSVMALIAVMLWPMDERPAARGYLRWWRR